MQDPCGADWGLGGAIFGYQSMLPLLVDGQELAYYDRLRTMAELALAWEGGRTDPA